MVAIGMCSPEKMMYSYGSSVNTMRSCSMQTLAMASSSARENTWPVGLCGEFRTSARARGVTAARRAASSNFHSGGVSGTNTGFAPQRIASGP